MGLFKKNENETAFVGGKKNFREVIKNEGTEGALFWKDPREDFNSNTTLIVKPGEQAIFVNEGKIEQVFEEGTYVLQTKNYPFLSRIPNSLTGGISKFNAVIYFANTTSAKTLRWGTQRPLQVRDCKYDIDNISIRARASYSIKITNPAVFLRELYGNQQSDYSFEEIEDELRDKMYAYIQDAIKQRLNHYEQGIHEATENLVSLSKQVAPNIEEIVMDFGLSLKNFLIEDIEIDPESANVYKEMNKSSVWKRQGTNFQEATMMDVMKEAAKNPGSGGMANMGMGLGMGVATGNYMGTMAGQMMNPMYQQPMYQQPMYQPLVAGQMQAVSNNMQQPMAGQMQNMPNDSQQPDSGQEDPMAVLGKLKQLMDAGLIEKEEYDAKKAEVLSRL